MGLREALLSAAAGILFCVAVVFLFENLTVIEEILAVLNRDISIVMTQEVHYGCIG